MITYMLCYLFAGKELLNIMDFWLILAGDVASTIGECIGTLQNYIPLFYMIRIIQSCHLIWVTLISISTNGLLCHTNSANFAASLLVVSQ